MERELLIYRSYQQEADDATYLELVVRKKDRVLIKMFCGTGKSTLMRQSRINRGKKLVGYVFPSLSLIKQFQSDYLSDAPDGTVLQISSEAEATTDPTIIKRFLSKKENLIICVTYQSFKTLLDNLGDMKISVCHYDEAHHAVGETYQKLIFENNSCEKQIFYTATPKNANGVVMHDRERPDAGMCLAYDYSYQKGLREGYLNPFEIRVDMFTENTNRSQYECLSRAILSSKNTRILTFHSDVKTDRPTSVHNFVNEDEFKKVFNEVQKREFPKNKTYKRITMIGMSAEMNGKERRDILDKFDKTSNDEIMIISSCETIGEGIDTKRANMCMFVDPKSSYVKIIQNIGRIVRKQERLSTILIPCWVDKSKYLHCEGDKEKCDEVIRQSMSEGGDFNFILNVLSALKQEDEDLYDICLNYPETYSPQEVMTHLETQGYTVGEPRELQEAVEYLLEEEVEGVDLMEIAQEHEVCIEVVNHSLDTPLVRYNEGCDDTIRLYETDDGYCPLQKESKRHRDTMVEPNRENRIQFKVHTHPDVKVLWNIQGDPTANIRSSVIDCEVVVYDPMDTAIGIVERADEREKKGCKRMPLEKRNMDESSNQEYKDSIKLRNWRYAVKGKKGFICSDNVRNFLDIHLSGWSNDLNDRCMNSVIEIVKRTKERVSIGESMMPKYGSKDSNKLLNLRNSLKGRRTGRCADKVRDYLDEHLPGWRDENDLDEEAMSFAIKIVERAHKRFSNGGKLLPTYVSESRQTNEELKQEYKDAQKLTNWKDALKGIKGTKCCDKVRDYLDEHLHGWRDEIELDEEAMSFAIKIVERAHKRFSNGGKLLPIRRDSYNITNDELEQEQKDRTKLNDWTLALKSITNGMCPVKVRDYLDIQLPGWRSERNDRAMNHAREIVSRAEHRRSNRGQLLPRQIAKVRRINKELELENKDNSKLSSWKDALKGIKGTKCSDEVRDYLDEHLPGWRDEKNEKNIIKKSMKLKEPSKPQETVVQKRERVHSELSQLHKEFKTLRSDNLHDKFKKNPEIWHNYHAISEANEESFPTEEIPRNRIIQKLGSLKFKKTKQVVDMGCGNAQIAEHFIGDKRFEFTNFDHISSKDSVVSCDISNTGLEENSIEICILSLAMWGSNCASYLEEAFRILETCGRLYIIEPTKRWTDKDEKGIMIIEKKGERLKMLLQENGFQILEQEIEKFCLFTCGKGSNI
jgi:superfamily II DNA or RNA helicase